MISIHNGAQAVKRVKNSGFMKLLGEMSGNPMLMEDDLLDELDNEQDEELLDELDNQESDPIRLLGNEITLGFGAGTDTQVKNLSVLGNRFIYCRFRELAKILVASLEDGEIDNGEIDEMGFTVDAMMNEEMMTAYISDPQIGRDLLSSLSMPPTYVAFRSTPEFKEADAALVEQSFSMLAMFEEIVTEVETSVAGNEFVGYKIIGKQVAKTLEETRDEALEVIDEATFDKLVSAVGEKDLVILTGIVGDYVVVFLGSSEGQLKLAASTDDSLASSKDLAFVDSYLSKDLFTVIHGSSDLISTVTSLGGRFGVIADGVRDGLDGTTGLGDTRDIVALLQVVADRESAYMKMMQPSATGSVSYFEDGLKLESFGGIDAGAIEWEAENRLGALGEGEDVFLFANLSTSAEFEKVVGDYYEAILESLYTIGMKVAEKGGEMEDLQQFNQEIMMFDKAFRNELVAMWKAFTVGMEEGPGRERAWILDLSGSMPPIPGIPQEIVDSAKFPRLSVVAPVADRAKLQSSWTTINESATRALKKVSEMMGEEIPMQKPMSSESSGVMTWSFSFPFFNDDFLSSVTLDDNWFTVTTSKKQALDLVAKASKSDTKNKGAMMEIDFKALHTYLKDMMPVLKENGESLGMSEDDISEMMRISELISELDRLSVNTRKEGGIVRTSIHFKTR